MRPLDLWHADKQRRGPMRQKVSLTLGASKVGMNVGGEKKKKNVGKMIKKIFFFFFFDSFTEGRDRREEDLERLLNVTFGERGKD